HVYRGVNPNAVWIIAAREIAAPCRNSPRRLQRSSTASSPLTRLFCCQERTRLSGCCVGAGVAPMIRTVLCFAAMLGIWPNAAIAQTVSDPELLADHLLWAIGGRPAWASVTSTVLYSDQYRKSDGTAVGAVSTSDYERSRLRIDTTGAQLQQIRIVDSTGDRSWRVDRQGRLEKVAE